MINSRFSWREKKKNQENYRDPCFKSPQLSWYDKTWYFFVEDEEIETC